MNVLWAHETAPTDPSIAFLPLGRPGSDRQWFEAGRLGDAAPKSLPSAERDVPTAFTGHLGILRQDVPVLEERQCRYDFWFKKP